MIIHSMEDYYSATDQYLWPFPDAQLAWLVQNIPILNGGGTAEALKSDHELRHYWLHSSSLRCQEHKELFCEHNVPKLSAGQRSLAALSLLEKKNPTVAPPPIPF